MTGSPVNRRREQPRHRAILCVGSRIGRAQGAVMYPCLSRKMPQPQFCLLLGVLFLSAGTAIGCSSSGNKSPNGSGGNQGASAPFGGTSSGGSGGAGGLTGAAGANDSGGSRKGDSGGTGAAGLSDTGGQVGGTGGSTGGDGMSGGSGGAGGVTSAAGTTSSTRSRRGKSPSLSAEACPAGRPSSRSTRRARS